jgi:hypothetical protein
MNKILQDLIDNRIIIYMENILIYLDKIKEN